VADAAEMLILAAQGHRPVMFAEIAMRQALHKNPGGQLHLPGAGGRPTHRWRSPSQAACQGLQFRSLITALRWGDLALRSPTSSLSGLVRVPTLSWRARSSSVNQRGPFALFSRLR